MAAPAKTDAAEGMCASGCAVGGRAVGAASTAAFCSQPQVLPLSGVSRHWLATIQGVPPGASAAAPAAAAVVPATATSPASGGAAVPHAARPAATCVAPATTCTPFIASLAAAHGWEGVAVGAALFLLSSWPPPPRLPASELCFWSHSRNAGG